MSEDAATDVAAVDLHPPTGYKPPLFQRVDWQDNAACNDLTPQQADKLFHRSGAVPKATLLLCAGCPVRQRCFEYGRDNGEEYGIWGGVHASRIHAATAAASPRSNGGGQGINKTKLTEADVLTIRRRFDAGEKFAHIALDYDASKAAVRKVALRVHFKHVPEDASQAA